VDRKENCTMKKVLVLLVIAFGATYCNPAQQTEQTNIDSTATNSATNSVTTDTTARDTTRHQ
jgi:hypothetical protein